jgi:hypothetical protein
MPFFARRPSPTIFDERAAFARRTAFGLEGQGQQAATRQKRGGAPYPSFALQPRLRRQASPPIILTGVKPDDGGGA